MTSEDSAKPPPALDETTPLLAASSNNQIQEADAYDGNGSNLQKDDHDKPLPRLQIFLLCYARLVEPVAYFCIFPFVNQMIKDTGDIKEEDVGFYSGLIESLFSLTQMLVMIFWGRASDRFGRKPVLCFALFGVTVATAMFGLSQTVWQMILFRCLAGVFAGTVVTVRTMISENSTKRTQARAFSWFAFSGNFGIFLGPLLGGGLAQPAKEYPKVFGNVQLFKDYPYALPTFATGALALSAAILCTLFIKETLQVKKRPMAEAEPSMSIWGILNSPGVSVVLYIYGHVQFLGLAFTAVAPVFYFEPIHLGGFGFSPKWISIIIATGGLSQALWLLLLFPPLQHRFGTGGVLRACVYVWSFFFLLFPVLNLFLKQDWEVAFWIVVFFGTAFGSGVAMGFTAVQLALNDISPSSTTFGTLNALALALTSGIRAVTPAAFSSLYATGVKYQILGGELIWLILIICALTCVVGVRFLPAKAEGKITADEDECA